MLDFSYLILLGAGFALQGARHGFADQSRAFRNVDARSLEGRNLVRRRALAARNDSPGMAHAAPGRRGAPGNESHNGLPDVRLDKLRRQLFAGAADLSDDDDTVRLLVFVHQPERVNK